MKKLIFIIGLFSVAYAQTNCTQPAKNYVDTYIVPNGNNAITGQKANTAFNLIIKAINCNDSISKTVRKVDTIYKNSTKDSIVFLINGIRYAIKDSIGTGGGGSNNIYKNGLTKSNDTVYGGGQITDLSYSNSTDLLFNLDSTGQLYLPKIDTYTPSSEYLIDSFPNATRNTLLDTFVNLFFSGDYTSLCFGDSTGTADKIRRRDYDKLVLDTLNFPACTSGQEGFTMLQFKFSNAVIPDGYYIDSFSVIFSGYDTLNCGGNINLSNVQSPYWSIYDGNHFITPDNFSFFAEKLDNPLVSGSDTIGLMNAHFDTATTNIDSLVISVLLPLYQDYQILTPLTHDYKGLYDKIYIRYKLNPIVNNLIIIGNQVFKTTYSVPVNLKAGNGIAINSDSIELGGLTKNTAINGNSHDYEVSNASSISLTAEDVDLFANAVTGRIRFNKNGGQGIYFKGLGINNSAQYVLGTNSITAAGGNVDWLEISTLGGQNFANANLTFDANRSHNLNGYNLNLFGGNIEIQGTDTTTIDSGSPSSYFNSQNSVDKPALSFYANNNGAVQPAMTIGASNSGGGADIYVSANKINWLSLSTDDAPTKLLTEGSDGYMKKTSVDSLDYVPITGTYTNKEITGAFFFKNGALADRGFIGYSTSQGLQLGAPVDGIVDEETFLRIKSTHFYLLHTDNNSGYDYGVRADNNGVRVDGSPTGVGAYGQYDFSSQADSLEYVQACFVKKYVDSVVSNLVIYKTKAEMDVIKTNNELVAGSYYLISGVHPTLYDDGTTSGSSILLQALDSNTLSKDGQGLFYNPPYKIGVAGHGVTDTSSTYSIGDTSFWGGYVWVCNTNGQAVATDVLNLDGNWTKLTYSSGAYNSVFDVISYDYSNDVIVRRYEADKDNDVIFTKEDDINMGLGYNAIQVFMFGNLNNDNVGIHGNKIINSYFECVNFRGTKINLNNLTHNSSISNNHYTISSDLYLNTLENAVVTNNYNLRFGNNNLTTSVIDNNKFILNSYMSGNSCINSYMSNNYLYNSNILENILVVTSSITDDSLVSSYISSNNLSAGFITGLSLKNGSYVDNNLIRNSEVTTGTLNASRITKNNFETISFVNYFTLTVNSAISYNNLKNSTITDVIADSTSYFIYNTLENSSIESFELSYNSYIMKNNMYNALFQSLTSAPLSSKVIEGVVFERAEILATDFSSATNIFGTYSKWIFSRADGTPRLKYYNNLDLPVIVNVDN